MAYQPNTPNPFAGDDTPDLRNILAEVKRGCPAHEKKLVAARELWDWYHGDSEKFISFRPAEDALSWLTRPKRVSFITRQAVYKLTGFLYKPGPRRRRIGADDAVDAWYLRVVQDIHLNSLMQQVDRLLHLHGMCLLGVYPTGVTARPINYHLFRRDEFVYWTAIDDPRVATAICTISKAGPDLVRYRLWTNSHYYTFYKGKAWGYTPGGASVARFDPASSGPHPYDGLPFAVLTHELPTTELETDGVGYMLAKINRALNIDKSNLAHWVHHYARPLGFVTGVGPEWRPRFVEGGFVPLTTRINSTEDVALVPEAKYLESHINIDAIRSYIMSEANQGLAEMGLPLTMTAGAEGGRLFSNRGSGIAIAAEDADLITYAKGRQPVYERHENTIAALVCRIGGCPIANSGHMAATLIKVSLDPSLRIAWSEPQIDLPGEQRDLADTFELENGITDPIEIIMRRQGMSEGEAVEQYTSVCRRRHLASRIDAEQAAMVAAAGTIAAAMPPGERNPADWAPVGEMAATPDMGVEGGAAPSASAQAAPGVAPNVTVATGVAPDMPIPAAPLILPASPGFGGWGTES